MAREGLKGLQVEGLARNLNLNKSGFYHYFGDLDSFCKALIQMHERIAENYFQELREINTIDPDYFHLLMRYKVSVMFQMQLFMVKNNQLFQSIAGQIERKENTIVQPLWSEYWGIADNPDITIRYFNIVRDMFYARITFENFEYSYLKNLIAETKEIIHQVSNRELYIENK